MRVGRRVQNRAIVRALPAQPVHARRTMGSKLAYRSRDDQASQGTSAPALLFCRIFAAHDAIKRYWYEVNAI